MMVVMVVQFSGVVVQLCSMKILGNDEDSQWLMKILMVMKIS